jgi:hypothetical protein
LFTRSVWAPTGLNLGLVPTLPGPSILAAPLTRAFGPIVSFNVLSLIAPPLAAWTAYLLARRVTRRFWPSVVGGLLFGFSPDMTREMLQGHVNLSMVFLIPLAVYLILRRVDGTMGRTAFVVLLTLVLVGEFSIFIEIYATMAVVAALVALAAILMAPEGMKRKLLDTAALTGTAFFLSALLMAPYMWVALTRPDAMKPPGFDLLAAGAQGPADLLRYALPGRFMAINFGMKLGYNFWYFGIPLLAILAHYWITHRQSFPARVLAVAFFIAVLLALGSQFHVGTVSIPMPWTPFAHLPLLGRARAGRIIIYAYLIASLTAAMWLAEVSSGGRRAALRWTVAALAVITFVPNLVGSGWTRNVPLPAFFSSGQYRASLCPGEIVLAVDRGPSRETYWQAQTGMYFRTVTWYRGFQPADYVDLQLALNLVKGKVGPDDAPAVGRFMAEHQVSTVIVGRLPRVRRERLELMLGVLPQSVGGVTLIRLAPCAP